MTGVHGTGRGRKADPPRAEPSAPPKPAPKAASIRRKEQRLAQKARQAAGIAPPPPGPKRAAASPRPLRDGRNGTWMRERSPEAPVSAKSANNLNERRRKTEQRAEAEFDAKTERELRAKGELPAPKKKIKFAPCPAVDSAVSASTEFSQLHPRNERNRELFRSHLSRDPVTGTFGSREKPRTFPLSSVS